MITRQGSRRYSGTNFHAVVNQSKTEDKLRSPEISSGNESGHPSYRSDEHGNAVDDVIDVVLPNAPAIEGALEFEIVTRKPKPARAEQEHPSADMVRSLPLPNDDTNGQPDKTSNPPIQIALFEIVSGVEPVHRECSHETEFHINLLVSGRPGAALPQTPRDPEQNDDREGQHLGVVPQQLQIQQDFDGHQQIGFGSSRDNSHVVDQAASGRFSGCTLSEFVSAVETHQVEILQQDEPSSQTRGMLSHSPQFSEAFELGGKQEKAPSSNIKSTHHFARQHDLPFVIEPIPNETSHSFVHGEQTFRSCDVEWII